MFPLDHSSHPEGEAWKKEKNYALEYLWFFTESEDSLDSQLLSPDDNGVIYQGKSFLLLKLLLL